MSQDTIKLLKKSLHEIRRLKQEVNTYASRTPVAVVGMACRFPGGSDTPEKFWELLENGHEGLCDVPDNRWNSGEYFDEEPGKPLKMYTQKLNFLAEDVSLFDSRLFTISPREAEEMDPRQRLLLELTWEALERSGHAPKELKGQAVGVFMGAAASEYALLPRDMAATGPHTMPGLLNSMVSGCIAHSFGFHGPAISVDTACSSSMVSIHQACKSIQDNECHMAIAGGAGLMLSPLPMLDLCKRHVLSKDGRCKTFSANGDGYGRGEGAGVVVLKRLDMAQRDGDPVLAVIESSNLNNGGSASGLTAPNGKAQQKLLQETLDRAGIQPRDIGYIELHGIGTSPDDPVEFQSLAGVFGQDRSPDSPLMLGTCKANIGHLEAAAGIASVIKTVLCLQNRAVPAHINCAETDPRIPLQRIPAILPGSHKHWETHDGEIRRAGISSFGFSGTNAFIVIREAPEKALTLNMSDIDPGRQKHILTISAQSKSALNELVGRYRDYVSGSSVTGLPSFAHTINVGRSHFNWRAACVWANREELLSGLSDVASEQHAGRNIWHQPAPTDAEKRVSVIFPGKLNGMFDGLLPLIESCPHFQETWKICEDAFSRYTSSPLTHLLTRQREHFLAIPLDEAAIIFSISCSMFDFFRYLGIRVSTVYAEGEGVFSMAASTGLVSLEQAIQGLVQGYMDKEAHESLAEEYQFCMPLFRVILPGSKEPLERSGLSDPALLDCAYNEPGSREDIREIIGGDGVLVFEMDTRPQVASEIYGGGVSDCAASCLETVSWNSVVNFVAECYSHGHSIDWQRFDEGFKREKLVCPTYPFQRRSYWIDTSPDLLLHGRTTTPSGHTDTTPANPLEGRVRASPLKASQVLFTLGPENLPTLSDTDYIVHVGHFLEMLMSGLKLPGKKSNHIRFLTFDSALVIPEGEEKELHMMLEASSDSATGSATAIDSGTNFSFHTPGKHADDWNQHVHGVLGGLLLPDNVPDKQDFSLIRSRCVTKISGEAFYQTMVERGFVSGASVRWVDQVWRRDGEALARFRLATPDECLSPRGLGVSPGVWVSCFQLLHATLEEALAPDTRFVLVGTGAIDFFPVDISPAVWCHVTSLGQASDDGVLDGAFTLYTDSGEIIAHCYGCEMKAQVADKKEDAENASESYPDITGVLKSATSPDQQLAVITQYIKEIICDLLKVPEDEIGVSDSINQPGMSSLLAVALRDKLNKQFDVSVPAPFMLQGPTPEELAREIQQQFNGSRHTETGAGESRTTPDDNTTIIPAYSQVSLEKHKWVQGKRTENAKINLYCLPYGGGGASLYRGWATAFPEDVNVLPIQFPGREDRILEQPVESVQELLEMLTEVLGDDLNHPFAIYGHSAGALIAYAWARYLKKHNQPKPECLFVGGFTAPFIPSPYLGVVKSVFCEGGFDGIPGVDEFIQQMQQGSEKIKKCMTRITEVTGIALHQEEFSDAILPQLVADCKLVESLDSQGAGCLNIPIAALHGMDDDRVSTMGMGAWKSLTTDKFFMETFPGDHFFLHADQSEQAVTRYIYDLLARSGN